MDKNLCAADLEALNTVINSFCTLVMTHPQFAIDLYKHLDCDEDAIEKFTQYAISRVLEESTQIDSPLVVEARKFIVDELCKHNADLTSWGYEVSVAVKYYGQILPGVFL